MFRGGDQRPKITKKGQKPAFLQRFLVLHKSEKVASQPHLKRPSCELFGAPGPKEKRKTCICTVFSCVQEEKHAFLQAFWLLRAQPETQRGRKNISSPACLYAFFCILGDRVKGARVKGFWGKWVLGTRVLGIWGLLKRGNKIIPTFASLCLSSSCYHDVLITTL